MERSDGKIKGKRRRRRPRRQLNRVQLYSQAGVQALRDINALRKFINTEVKCVDTLATENSTTTATLDLLNGMTQGNANGNRSGQSVKCENVDLRFVCTIAAAAVTSFVRVLVVMDKQANGAVFAIGSLLNATTVVSHYTVGSQNRFVVFFDETFAMDANGQQCLTKVVRLNDNSHTEYGTGNAGTIADINSNSLYLVHLSDQVANPVSIQYYIRYWYVDN